MTSHQVLDHEGKEGEMCVRTLRGAASFGFAPLLIRFESCLMPILTLTMYLSLYKCQNIQYVIVNI